MERVIAGLDMTGKAGVDMTGKAEVDMTGKAGVDLGCGAGGITLHLARHLGPTSMGLMLNAR